MSAAVNSEPVDLLVVEAGERVGASVCAALLAQLGATVFVLESDGSAPPRHGLSSKSRWRDLLMAGKHSVYLDDEPLVEELMTRADVVITSSDITPGDRIATGPRRLRPSAQIVCDITAWGRGGPCTGQAHCETQMQALSGILGTTGAEDGPPMPVPIPLIETLCGVQAAGAVLAAARLVMRGGPGQHIDMALYDTGFTAMSSFFSRLLIDQSNASEVRRIGSRHTLSAPWNVYRARDGWALICTGSDLQWQRLCELMSRTELARDARYAKSADRVARVAEVDSVVQAWVADRSVAECVDALCSASIAGGPIVPIEGYPRDQNLMHRQMIQQLKMPNGAPLRYAAASPLGMRRNVPPGLTVVPARGTAHSLATSLLKRRLARVANTIPAGAPLAGLRVIEIGHYTTAPICTRHLAALGAEVIKIEPPGGEASRHWPPLDRGQSVYYTISNSDKRSVMLDLTRESDRSALRTLLSDADALIENLKPGVLGRHGFSPDEIEILNPRLVYCAISGFGSDSIYAGRAAFDTVIQGMSGLMHLLRGAGTPVKTGISTADVLGASMAVVAVLGALAQRDKTGRGQFIDLSMQDVLVWATQTAWEDPPGSADSVVAPCRDGFLLVRAEKVPEGLAGLSQDEAVQRLRQLGVDAVQIRTPSQVIADPQTAARGLHFKVRDERGEWPALAVPLRLLGTPPVVRRPGPELAHDNSTILNSLAARAAV